MNVDEISNQILVWLAQAQRFADKDNYVDAVARASACCVEVSRVKKIASVDRDTLLQLEALEQRATALRDTFKAREQSWNEAIRQRRFEAIGDADAEMKRPLPLPKDFR